MSNALNLIDNLNNEGEKITWSSSSNSVVNPENGTISPSVLSSTTLSVTAKVTKGTQSKTKLFFITVPKASSSDADVVARDMESLTFDSFRANNSKPSEIYSELSLTKTGKSQLSSISWSSNNEAVINSSSGKIVAASNPTDVDLTATIQYNAETQTKTFSLKVPVIENDDADVVTKDKSKLVLTDFLGNNRDGQKITEDCRCQFQGKWQQDFLVNAGFSHSVLIR